MQVFLQLLCAWVLGRLLEAASISRGLRCIMTGGVILHGQDKAGLAAEVRLMDREAWATTNTLRLSAAFRHYSQACLRRREWVPKAGVSPNSTHDLACLLA